MACDALVKILPVDVKDGHRYSDIKACVGKSVIDPSVTDTYMLCPKTRLPCQITEHCYKRKEPLQVINPVVAPLDNSDQEEGS
jgi:hypothetical protein